MIPSDIETIERATLDAVSPEALEELDGWLLPFDSGTVGRARSAVPLKHMATDETMLGRIEARYAARGMPAVFRIANEACFDALRRELGRRGYRAGRPVLVQVGAARAMRGVSTQIPAETASSPDEAWAPCFWLKASTPSTAPAVSGH